MAFTYTPTTELEAVNAMLATCGESPVNTLSLSGAVDVAIAYQMLYECSRQVQTEDWHFNSEPNYPLVPDTAGHLLTPPNTLKIKVSPAYAASFDLAHRGDRMYDRIAHTDVFSQTVKFDIVLFLPFTSLPEAARKYITLLAARQFQDKFLSSDTLHKLSEEDIATAKSALEDSDGLNADLNMMNNYDVFRVIDRDSDFYGNPQFVTAPS